MIFRKCYGEALMIFLTLISLTSSMNPLRSRRNVKFPEQNLIQVQLQEDNLKLQICCTGGRCDDMREFLMCYPHGSGHSVQIRDDLCPNMGRSYCSLRLTFTSEGVVQAGNSQSELDDKGCTTVVIDDNGGKAGYNRNDSITASQKCSLNAPFQILNVTVIKSTGLDVTMLNAKEYIPPTTTIASTTGNSSNNVEPPSDEASIPPLVLWLIIGVVIAIVVLLILAFVIWRCVVWRRKKSSAHKSKGASLKSVTGVTGTTLLEEKTVPVEKPLPSKKKTQPAPSVKSAKPKKESKMATPTSDTDDETTKKPTRLLQKSGEASKTSTSAKNGKAGGKKKAKK